MILNGTYLVWFEILYQLPVFYPRGDPIVTYTLNFNNFSTTRPILDPKMSLNRAHQNLIHTILCLMSNSNALNQ